MSRNFIAALFKLILEPVNPKMFSDWFSLAHKQDISITSRHPRHKRKHKQKHKKNEPTYLSYAVLTCAQA